MTTKPLPTIDKLRSDERFHDIVAMAKMAGCEYIYIGIAKSTRLVTIIEYLCNPMIYAKPQEYVRLTNDGFEIVNNHESCYSNTLYWCTYNVYGGTLKTLSRRSIPINLTQQFIDI